LKEHASNLEALSEARKKAERSRLALLDLEIELEVERTPEWVSQKESPLGHDTHLELVRAGKLTGYKRGKQIFVRREEIDAFIEGGLLPPKARPAPAPPASGASIADELRAELGLAPRGSRRAS
jgi:hypothetical protein